MSYKVVLTDTAVRDLRDIAFWITDMSKNADIAKSFVSELRAECEKLRDFPNSGALPHDRMLKSAGYRFTTFREYLIFYTVNEEAHRVNIMAIFHEKKDYTLSMTELI